MPKFTFMVYGEVVATSIEYAHQDIRKAFEANMPRLKHLDHRIFPERPLCEGSEESATNVMNSSDAAHPYNLGRCGRCGVYVPLLSAGQFEVIKHFAPSGYPLGEADKA
jgi:hypothetical protein